MARRRALQASDYDPTTDTIVARTLAGDEMWAARWFGVRSWWTSNTPDRAVTDGVTLRMLSLDESMTDRQRCTRVLATPLGKTCPTDDVYPWAEKLRANRP